MTAEPRAPKIFISYRRDDAAFVATALSEKLVGKFGSANVFMDVDAIPAGRNYKRHLEAAVGASDVVLAIIGDRWIEMSDDQGQRRLDLSTDWVRIELEAALKRDVPVIPVLVGDASIPAPADLPSSLQEIAYRQAVPLRPGRDFLRDVESLGREIERTIAYVEAPRPPRVTPPPTQPDPVAGDDASVRRPPVDARAAATEGVSAPNVARHLPTLRWPGVALLAVTIAGAVLLGRLLAPGGSEHSTGADLKDLHAKIDALNKTVEAAKGTAPAPTRPSVDPNKVYSLSVGDSPIQGDRAGKVTIVEFADYQCPFCAQAEGLVDQVLKAYPKDVRRVYKQFPLTSIHPNALPAAKAALAAGKQGKFWEMHDKLFGGQRELGTDNYKRWARDLGLDVARFERDMSSPEIQAQIDKETQEARAADVTGTPTMFVNGKRLMQRSFDGFKTAIDAARTPTG